MESKTFSLRRISLVFKYNFITYARSYMTYFAALMGVILIIFLLSLLSGNATNSFFISWFSTSLIFTSIIIPGMGFRELRSKTAATTYLTLPASTTEKFIVPFLLTTIGAILAQFLMFALFNLLAIVLAGFFHTQLEFYQFWNSPDFWDLIKAYFILHSLFFFGATAFKKSQILQTILWTTVILSTIGIIIGLTAATMAHNLIESYNFNLLAIAINNEKIKNTIQITGKIITTLIVLLLWLASYFKLKEKEVV